MELLSYAVKSVEKDKQAGTSVEMILQNMQQLWQGQAAQAIDWLVKMVPDYWEFEFPALARLLYRFKSVPNSGTLFVL